MMAVALFVARTQQPAGTIRQLHLAECQDACLAGIQVNHTTPTEAQLRISQLFVGYTQRPISIAGDTSFYTWEKQYGSAINVIFNHGVAATVGIGTNSPDNSMPQLGDILVAIGPPDCLYVSSKAMVLIYEPYRQGNTLVVATNRFALTQPINSITLTVQSQVNCSSQATSRWRGLGSYNVTN